MKTGWREFIFVGGFSQSALQYVSASFFWKQSHSDLWFQKAYTSLKVSFAMAKQSIRFLFSLSDCSNFSHTLISQLSCTTNNLHLSKCSFYFQVVCWLPWRKHLILVKNTLLSYILIALFAGCVDTECHNIYFALRSTWTGPQCTSLIRHIYD